MKKQPELTMPVPLADGTTLMLKPSEIRSLIPVQGVDGEWVAWLGVCKDVKRSEVQTALSWSAAITSIWIPKMEAMQS